MDSDLQSNTYDTSLKQEEKDIVATIKVKQEKVIFSDDVINHSEFPVTPKTSEIHTYSDFQRQMDSDFQSKTYDTSFKQEKNDIVATIKVKQEKASFNEINDVINKAAFPVTTKTSEIHAYSDFPTQMNFDLQSKAYDTSFKQEEKDIDTMKVKLEQANFNELNDVINQSAFCVKEEIDIKCHKVENVVEPNDQVACDAIYSNHNDRAQYGKQCLKNKHIKSDRESKCGQYSINCHLDTHVNSVDNRVKKYQLNSCSNIFSCDICTKRFNRKAPLTTHMRVHTGERPFSCNICRQRFNYKHCLSRHIRLHTGDKPFSCNICTKKFNYKLSLTRHMKVHSGERPYSCNTCSKTFYDSSNLSNHMKIHSGKGQYLCNICNKAFSFKFNLVLHIRVHTGEKPYCCNICNKSFIQRPELITHMRLHTGEKPYACNICNKTFTQKGGLNIHMREHSGEKNYQLNFCSNIFSCDICSKMFSRKYHLTRHLRVHSNERPFRCNICSYKCHRKDHLTTHLRVHSGNMSSQ